MKKLITFLLLIMVMSVSAWATSGEYTYQKDRKFTDIRQLNNQTFLPQKYVEGMGSKKEVDPGSIKIHFSSRLLVIEGLNNMTVAFNIVAAHRNMYGYEFKLADSRGYDFSTLNVVLDNQKYIQMIYLGSQKYGDYSFYLARKTKSQLKKEKSYFTSKTEYQLASMSHLVGVDINPYRLLHDYNNPSLEPERIAVDDDINLKFGDGFMTFSENGKVKKLKIKTKRSSIYEAKGYKSVSKIMELRVNKSPKKVKLFLNDTNQIEFIQLKDARYFLR